MHPYLVPGLLFGLPLGLTLWVMLDAIVLNCLPPQGHRVLRCLLRGWPANLMLWYLVSARQEGISWNRLRVLCHVMDWPLSWMEHPHLNLNLVQHPTRGLVWGVWDGGKIPFLRPRTDDLPPAILDRMLSLDQGVNFRLAHDFISSMHALLRQCTLMRARGQSQGQCVRIPTEETAREVLDRPVEVLLRRGRLVVSLKGARSVLDRLDAPAWNLVWTEPGSGSAPDWHLNHVLYLPKTARRPA